MELKGQPASPLTCAQVAAGAGHVPNAARAGPRRAGSSARRRPAMSTAGARATSTASYWHHKQTGIKSRPIKLIEHPIENIERKIIFTYLFSLLFRLLALVVGPPVFAFFYLITAAVAVSRNLIWLCLNSWLLGDAKIKTCLDLGSLTGGWRSGSKGAGEGRAQWRYCPLNYLETYWFKERLVNHVILVIKHRVRAAVLVETFKQLVEQNVLAKSSNKRFLCRVVARGLPFYRSYYWHFLDSDNGTSLAGHNNKRALEEARSSSRSSPRPSDDGSGCSSSSLSCSVSLTPSSLSSTASCQSSLDSSTAAQSSSRVERAAAGSGSSADVGQHTFNIDQHIFMDDGITARRAGNAAREPSLKDVREYTVALMNSSSMNLNRPLWDIRVIGGQRTSYLLLRCHQSLADGESLGRLLVDQLSDYSSLEAHSAASALDEQSTAPAQQAQAGQQRLDSRPERSDDKLNGSLEEEEDQLKPIKVKKSFISRIGRATSLKNSIILGPITVLLWIVWTFTRRKQNHLNCCNSKNVHRTSLLPLFEAVTETGAGAGAVGRSKTLRTEVAAASDEESVASSARPEASAILESDRTRRRRFHMSHYDLTKFFQIKQMTKSTVGDIILCALSGSLRDYLRKFNCVTNPPDLNVSLAVNMRGDAGAAQACTQVQEAGVNCTLVGVPLPVSIEGTVPRLWDLRAGMEEFRSSVDPWLMLYLKQLLFALLPVSWYQWLINYIALGNSSLLVSSFRGPRNVIESWCVDILSRAYLEPQVQSVEQPAAAEAPSVAPGENENSSRQPAPAGSGPAAKAASKCADARKSTKRRGVRPLEFRDLHRKARVSAIYYCMQPPTSAIPISFNCITYHDKLFVSVLSRSLLVEDSKLLIKLFFRQLNQLADTVGKRRSFMTLIRRPRLVEAPSDSTIKSVRELTGGSPLPDDSFTLVSGSPRDWRASAGSGSGSQHDLEANHGGDTPTEPCKGCSRYRCGCSRRRKSLFSFDQPSSLFGGLNPLQALVRRSSPKSKSRDCFNSTHAGPSFDRNKDHEDADDDRAAQFLLELDAFQDSQDVAGSAGKSDERPARRVSKSNPNFFTCPSGSSPLGQPEYRLFPGARPPEAPSSSKSSEQLLAVAAPHGQGAGQLQHSRSDTALVVGETDRTCSVSAKSKKKKNKNYRCFYRLASANSAAGDEREPCRKRTFVATSVSDLTCRSELSRESSTKRRARKLCRRQSIATTTGASGQASILVKDETNSEVALRCQPFGMKQSHRIRSGAAPHSRRRSSLIPFGLMQNQAYPRLFWSSTSETGSSQHEAHL